MAVYRKPIPPAVPLPAQGPDVPFPTGDWPIGQPPEAIAAALDSLLDRAFAKNGADEQFGLSLAFVAIHEGRLVAERYGPTAGPDESLISWSMARSFAHALLGIAVDQGRLDIHEPAPVTEWAGPDDPRSTITIDQLLRMVPGTEFNEDYIDENTSHCIEMLFGDGKDDMGAYTAALPAVHRPSEVLNYSSGASVVPDGLTMRELHGPPTPRVASTAPTGGSGRTPPTSSTPPATRRSESSSTRRPISSWSGLERRRPNSQTTSTIGSMRSGCCSPAIVPEKPALEDRLERRAIGTLES